MAYRGKSQEDQNTLVLSFLSLRQALGWIGFLLPFALIWGGLALDRMIYPSVSDSYYSSMGDVFVGAMCAIGVFLLCYTGYEREAGEILSDKWISRIAGAAALGVALLPTAPNPRMGPMPVRPLANGTWQPICSLLQCETGVPTTSTLHFACAGVFFAMLAIYCLFLFTRSGDAPPTLGKLRANRLYRICGWTLSGVIVAIGAIIGLNKLGWPYADALRSWHYLFWLESLGIWAFGLSWLVKGKSIGPYRMGYFSDARLPRGKSR